MSELVQALENPYTAISGLAAVLVAVRAALGGDCVQAGSHLEMGKLIWVRLFWRDLMRLLERRR